MRMGAPGQRAAQKYPASCCALLNDLAISTARTARSTSSSVRPCLGWNEGGSSVYLHEEIACTSQTMHGGVWGVGAARRVVARRRRLVRA